MGRTESTISLLVVLLFWPCVEVLGSSRIAPQDLIRRVCRKYASFQSYEDEGVVETTYDDLTRSNSEKMPFKVLFRRPGLFRFEWLDYYLWKDGKLTVLWRNANDTFLYQQPDIYEKKNRNSNGYLRWRGVQHTTFVNAWYRRLDANGLDKANSRCSRTLRRRVVLPHQGNGSTGRRE